MVDIKIKSPGKFQDVALLVDQENFIKRITDLRKIVKFSLDPNGAAKYIFGIPFSYRNYKADLELMNKYFLTYDQLTEFRKWLNDDKIFLPHLNKHIPYSYAQAIEDAASNLRFEYKKTHNFWPAIMAAIATNTVGEKDYTSIIFTEYAKNVADHSHLSLMDRKLYPIPQEGKWLAIFFQDYTTREEIDKVLDKEFPKYKKKDPIVSSAIILHRQWYWDYKRLGSYENVANFYKENNYNPTTIYRGVLAYKNLLDIAKVSD